MAERIFIVRHGETEWSRDGRHTGNTDVPLTEHGRAQARTLAGKLAGEHFALVLCSPLRRARETCELAGFADRVELCPDLREWDYGEYEGLTTPEILERDPDWVLWTGGCPGGEQPAEIRARLDLVLERCRSISGDALLFAHGHSLRSLTARWLEMEVATGSRFLLAAAAYGILGHERKTAVVERWNA